MPETNQDLPKGVKEHVPKHGQDIFREAYNSAYEEYGDPKKRKKGGSREETAARVAWNAVKSKYEKGKDNNWHRKEA